MSVVYLVFVVFLFSVCCLFGVCLFVCLLWFVVYLVCLLVCVCVVGRRGVAGGDVRTVVEFSVKLARVKIFQELKSKKRFNEALFSIILGEV